jgi:hypothetical protein
MSGEMKVVLAAAVVLAVAVVVSACAGVHGRGEPGPAPQAGPLPAPVSLSIRSVRTLRAHLPEIRGRKKPPAIRLDDSSLRFLLPTSSCSPVGVSAHAESRTLSLRLRPNHDFCAQVLRVVDVVVTLSRPVLRTNAITRVHVTYAPLPRPEVLSLVYPQI